MAPVIHGAPQATAGGAAAAIVAIRHDGSAVMPLGAGGTPSDLRVDRMMQALQVDRRELEQDYPKVLLDAEITCMRCRSKRQCFRELETGTVAANVENFCPNADLFLIFADDQGGSFRA